MDYKTVIGLEVHVELSTKTKIFCGCSTEFGGEPNSHVCPVCAGMPGTLPVLNREVAEKAIRAGIALNCEIQENNVFDRKNYFYPDLPKDYQISQLYHPICRNGFVEIDMGSYTKRVRIHEIHMEEDAGKLVHDAGASLVDYNRCGVPLIEIVSEPDLSSAEEVAAYLDKLREILVYLDVSDCKMEEGSMRADVNLSVMPEGAREYGTRTETKNMNSIKAIQRSIEYERARQIGVIESGGNVLQETRRWDDHKGENYAMRSKENAQDYRYFPDPDLVPLRIDEAWVARAKNGLPELAEEKRARYEREWGIPAKTAAVLTSEKNIALLFEEITTTLGGNAEVAREAANTVTGDVLGIARRAGFGAQEIESSTVVYEKAKALAKVRLVAGEAGATGIIGGIAIDPIKIARIITLVMEGAVNRASGKQIVEAVIMEEADPDEYVREHDLSVIRDDNLVEEVVAHVIENNPKSVNDYLSGKDKAFGFLVGQSMKELGGKADPRTVNEALKSALAKSSGAPTSGNAAPDTDGKTAAPDCAESKTQAGEGEGSENVLSTGLESGAGAEAQSETGDEDNGYTPAIPVWKRRLEEVGGVGAGSELGAQQGDYSAQNINTEVWQSGIYRTYNCGRICEDNIGEEIRLAGWVHSIRDHGGVMFVDLRDRYGVTQVVVSGEDAMRLHKESVISVSGKVRGRDEDTYNPNIFTGKVELKAENIKILGACNNTLPFEIESSKETKEELRLKYRFLDLRNPLVLDKMLLRSEIVSDLRRRMDALGFTEVQTPILANSSPEGARDYLVPSRKHHGMFYALPQAPQQFKQLLMVSGFDRYYQIAPCFRDEDARLDRSPGEFYQLDFEMSFATQEDVFTVAEHVLTGTFKRFTDKLITEPPYVRIPFKEAMLKYGSDKPDLRNPLVIFDLSEFFASVDFKPFKGKIVRAIRVPGAAAQPRSFFKSMEQYALSIGMKGLGYVTVQDDLSYKGPIDKFMDNAQKSELSAVCAGEGQALAAGDVLYFISDEKHVVAQLAGQVRTEVAVRLNLIDKDRYDFCFITDYPMYEWNEEAGKIDFTHNPFSMPQGEMEALLEKDPEDILAFQYDIVCNGVELSSGAVRNHRPDIMLKAFEIAGYDEKTVEDKFGALYSAFSYGAPPHAGMAPGVDRIVMLLSEDENIREIIPFPLDSNARNLMLGAPSEVTEQQLRDVHIKIR